jgi:hypothetical protein
MTAQAQEAIHYLRAPMFDLERLTKPATQEKAVGAGLVPARLFFVFVKHRAGTSPAPTVITVLLVALNRRRGPTFLSLLFIVGT